MRKMTKMKLGAILGAAAFLCVGGAFLAKPEAKATAEEVATPSLTMKAGNVIFGESAIQLKFAISAQDIDWNEVELLYWTDKPASYAKESGAKSILYNGVTEDVLGTECATFVYDGFSAKMMTDDIYVCAYAEVGGKEYYSAPRKYSILEYAYNKLGKTEATASTDEDFKNLLVAMLEYGAAAQKHFKVDGLPYNKDRLANADYTYVELSHAKFEDGFNYGLFQQTETPTVIPDNGYMLGGGANSAFTEENGVIKLTVPAEKFIATEKDFVVKPYTFADYDAGTQYAENEEHVLDENVTVYTTQCHFTSELRIYSSSTHDGYAIIKAKKPISSITFNAGNNADTLNVYGSKDDGNTWTLIEAVQVTSAYADHTVMVPGVSAYTSLKLDVVGTQQVRIKNFSLTYQEVITDADLVVDIAERFALDFTAIEGAGTKELPTTSEEATIEWELTAHADATLTGNVLSTSNPEENTTIVLKAKFAVNAATTEKTFEIALNHQISDEERVTDIAGRFALDFTEIAGATTIELPETSEETTIEWELTTHANANLDGYTLTTTNPTEETQLTLTATFTVNEASTEKTFEIKLKPQLSDADRVENAKNNVTLDFTDIEGAATIELPMTSEGVTIEWELTTHANANLDGYTLTTTNPTEETQLVLTATFKLNEAIAEKTFEISLKVAKVATEATLSFADKANRTSRSDSQQVWEQNGITFTNDKASSSNAVADYVNPVRLYAKSTATIAAPGNITKIVVNCNSTAYATALQKSAYSSGTASVSGKVVTITFTEPVTFVTITLDAQVRVDSLTVTYMA